MTLWYPGDAFPEKTTFGFGHHAQRKKNVNNYRTSFKCRWKKTMLNKDTVLSIKGGVIDYAGDAQPISFCDPYAKL
ncbi:hypothetical protein MY1884_008139 [Beauveria asiatica]